MEKEDKNKESLLEPEEDRVIADMNIEGMPWHTAGKAVYPENKEAVPPLTKKEAWSLTMNALAAALLVAFVFFAAFFLFIMFCIHVWLR